MELFVAGISMSISVVIGGLCLLVIRKAYQEAEHEVIKQLSWNMGVVTGALVVISAYWIVFQLSFSDVQLAVYPLYMSFLPFFGYLLYSLNNFGRMVKKYEIPEEEKLERMEDSERLDQDYYIKYD